MNTRLRTIILINLASILEKCDEQILPALYNRVGATFDATPTQLGNITLARAFMQAISSPFAGIACHFYPRSHIIGIGCILWAIFTALFACTSSIAMALPICAINGIGLALVIPSVQSLTADLNPSDSRGRAFGSLWLTISLGGMIGALFATNIGSIHPFGIEGWRFAFWTVAVLSAIAGILNAMYVHDPVFRSSTSESSLSLSVTVRRWSGWVLSFIQRQKTRSSNSSNSNHDNNSSRNNTINSSDDSHKLLLEQHQHQQHQSSSSPLHSPPSSPSTTTLRTIITDIRSVLYIPTFAIIIAQGIIGSIPYASLVFLTLYLQLLGMTDAAASSIVALYLIGGGLGGLLGGWIGDVAADKYPNHGRIAATQFSVASGIPFAFIIFKALPLDGQSTTVALYAITIFLFALSTAWPAPCANNPIFAEIVPIKQRNLVYSFDRCFEGAIAAFATPLVGLLSQYLFDFKGSSTVTGDPSIDLPNAQALGNALLVFLTVPWSFCLLAYSGLHWTYPRDRKKAYFINVSKDDTASISISISTDDEDGGMLMHNNTSSNGGNDDSEIVELGIGGSGNSGTRTLYNNNNTGNGFTNAMSNGRRVEVRRVSSRQDASIDG